MNNRKVNRSKITTSELILSAIYFLQQNNGVSAKEITRYVSQKRGQKQNEVKDDVKRVLDKATKNGIFSIKRGLYRIDSAMGKSENFQRKSKKNSKRKNRSTPNYAESTEIMEISESKPLKYKGRKHVEEENKDEYLEFDDDCDDIEEQSDCDKFVEIQNPCSRTSSFEVMSEDEESRKYTWNSQGSRTDCCQEEMDGCEYEDDVQSLVTGFDSDEEVCALGRARATNKKDTKVNKSEKSDKSEKSENKSDKPDAEKKPDENDKKNNNVRVDEEYKSTQQCDHENEDERNECNNGHCHCEDDDTNDEDPNDDDSSSDDQTGCDGNHETPNKRNSSENQSQNSNDTQSNQTPDSQKSSETKSEPDGNSKGDTKKRKNAGTYYKKRTKFYKDECRKRGRVNKRARKKQKRSYEDEYSKTVRKAELFRSLPFDLEEVDFRYRRNLPFTRGKFLSSTCDRCTSRIQNGIFPNHTISNIDHTL